MCYTVSFHSLLPRLQTPSRPHPTSSLVTSALQHSGGLMADMYDLPCGIREMSWGQCENEELEKKETGHVTVAQIEILVVSVNKLCFSSATATQIIFFSFCHLVPGNSAGCQKGHKGPSWPNYSFKNIEVEPSENFRSTVILVPEYQRLSSLITHFGARRERALSHMWKHKSL